MAAISVEQSPNVERFCRRVVVLLDTRFVADFCLGSA
jgi:hypothetical protein